MTIRRTAGWTPVPHDILDELSRAPLPRTHYGVVVAIARETLGYHRDEVTIAIGDLARACKLHPRSVRRAIVDLEQWRVVARRGAGQGRKARFRIRPPGQWKIGATFDALARRAARLRAGLAVQLELGLDGVAELSVLPLSRPLPCVTSRDTPRAASREVRPPSHPSGEEKESVFAREPRPASTSAAWLDVTGTHEALSRRLRSLGIEPPDDLWHRVGKALASARSRGRVSGDPLAYAELWILDDLRRLGRSPAVIRRSEGEPMPYRKMSDDQIDFVKVEQIAAERRLAAARMRLRWESDPSGVRRRLYFDDEEIAARAATMTDADVEAVFVELRRRREDANTREATRRSADSSRQQFNHGGRRRG